MKKSTNCSANVVKDNKIVFLSNYYVSENKEDGDEYKLFVNLSKFAKLLSRSNGIISSAKFTSFSKQSEFNGKNKLFIYFCAENIEWVEHPALFSEEVKSNPFSGKTFIGVDLLLKKVTIYTGGKSREINFKEFKDVLSHHKLIEVYLTKEVILGKGYGRTIFNFLTK